MQFFTLAIIFGAALASNPLLEASQSLAFCSSINSCVTTNGDPPCATSFCASYNSQATVTSAFATTTADGCETLKARQVVEILAPEKPRWYVSYHLLWKIR
jgi:hypothetical protein